MKITYYHNQSIIRLWLEGKGESWKAQSLRAIRLWDGFLVQEKSPPQKYDVLPATDTQTINDFCSYLLQLDISDTYKRLIFSRLRAFSDFVIATGALPARVNNFRHPQIRKVSALRTKPTRVMRALTMSEAVRVQRIAQKRGAGTYALFALLFGAGLRASEVRGIRRSSLVRYGEGTKLMVRQSKTSTVREVQIADWVRDALESRGNILEGKDPILVNWCRGTIWRSIKKLCVAAGVNPEWVGSHSGRVTSISTLLALGHSFEDVQIFTGHKSVDMIRLYDRRIKSAKIGRSLIYED